MAIKYTITRSVFKILFTRVWELGVVGICQLLLFLLVHIAVFVRKTKRKKYYDTLIITLEKQFTTKFISE
jgi:hypothetical protein